MLNFESVSVCGEKQENHDFIGITEEIHCACFAIADGKENGGTSSLAITTLLADFKEQADITTSTLPKIFDHIQEEVSSFQQEDLSPGGTAMAILLTDGELAVWAHIGDCRIYHLQDKLLYEITPDHSAAYSRYEAGEIRYPKIRTDRLRNHLRHLIGLDQNFKPSFSQPFVVRKNDSFLLCSDGFWENIHERQIEKTLKRSKNAKDWLCRMQKIVEKNRASKKYTKVLDDYSAITVRI